MVGCEPFDNISQRRSTIGFSNVEALTFVAICHNSRQCFGRDVSLSLFSSLCALPLVDSIEETMQKHITNVIQL